MNSRGRESREGEEKTDISYYRQKWERDFKTMREGEWKGRLSEPWMTACDATLVIAREDRGVYAASLALSPLMAVCVCVCVRRCGRSRQGCPCLDSGCSSVDGNTRGGMMRERESWME